MDDHGNLLGGRSQPSRGAGRYQLREGLHPDRLMASFPISDERDMEVALAGLDRASTTWASAPETVRRECLEAAARSIEDDVAGGEEVGQALGLGLDEARGLQRGLAEAVRDEFEPQAARANGLVLESGVAVCILDWRQLWAKSWAAIVGQLAGGRAVLLLPDTHLPCIAARIAAALLQAGVPASQLALLHGATDEAQSMAIGATGVRALVATGSASDISRLRRYAEAARIAEQRLRVPRVRAYEVNERADLGRAAREVVRGAFGRTTTLSGQLGGQIGRVFCPDRLHSRFTSALLSVLADDPCSANPVPLIDREAGAMVRRAWSLGLDEGATMIFGGTPARDEERHSPRHLIPTVFTNVEPFMETARRPAPAPVLALIRS